MKIQAWNPNQYDNAIAVAEGTIKRYVRELHETIIDMFTKIVQIGDILEWAYEYHGASGNYQEWVKMNTGLSVDTAGNYRNVARNFRDLNPDVLKAGTLSQFYRLAFDTVDQSARDWFQDYVALQIANNEDYVIDTGLERIARHAPDHVKARLASREINVAQAESLTRAYNDKALPKPVAQLAKAYNVTDGDVLLKWGEIYKDWVNTPAHLQSDKSWADIAENNFTLVWADGNVEREVHISTATQSDWNAYMNYRHSRRIAFSAPLRYSGTPNQIIRRNGRLVIEIPASTFEGDERDILEIELVVKAKRYEA